MLFDTKMMAGLNWESKISYNLKKPLNYSIILVLLNFEYYILREGESK